MIKKLESYSKAYQASRHRATSNTNSFIETPMHRVTMKQVPKKTKEFIQIKTSYKQDKQYHEDKNKERMLQAHGRFHKNQQAHKSPEDRCSKYGDIQHIEGFICLASRFQCKHCHKFGYFSSLCYKKKESEYKRDTRKPRAHQLMVGRASAQNLQCSQSDASFSSNDENILFANASQVYTN